MSKLSVAQIYEHLAKWAPENFAEPWDNVGLQVGELSAPVQSILVSLDVTEAVLWEAVHKGANLIITHHPLLFSPLKRLDNATAPSRLARLAVQMDLNIISFHTNLDATAGGLNDLLADQLGLKESKALIAAPPDPKTLKSHAKVGLGRVGKITKTTLKKFAQKTARNLNIKNLRSVGPEDHSIQRVAVMTGSGGGFFREAKQNGADVLITGDIKYHHALDALSEDIAMIDIGHFAGEIGMVALVSKRLQKFLKQKKKKLSVFETEVQSDPFKFWSFDH